MQELDEYIGELRRKIKEELTSPKWLHRLIHYFRSTIQKLVEIDSETQKKGESSRGKATWLLIFLGSKNRRKLRLLADYPLLGGPFASWVALYTRSRSTSERSTDCEWWKCKDIWKRLFEWVKILKHAQLQSDHRKTSSFMTQLLNFLKTSRPGQYYSGRVSSPLLPGMLLPSSLDTYLRTLPKNSKQLATSATTNGVIMRTIIEAAGFSETLADAYLEPSTCSKPQSDLSPEQVYAWLHGKVADHDASLSVAACVVNRTKSPQCYYVLLVDWAGCRIWVSLSESPESDAGPYQVYGLFVFLFFVVLCSTSYRSCKYQNHAPPSR